MKGELKIIDAYQKCDLSLRERIDLSDVFLITATPIYIKEMLNNKKEVIEAKKIAKELNKDVIVLIDIRLKDEDKIRLEEHLKGLRIVRRETLDMRDIFKLALIMEQIQDAYDVSEEEIR